jgi:bifunctional DNA-binding transcriptional regulator/antitoxin component of YhaV-PrlF toxin-antitoxin module
MVKTDLTRKLESTGRIMIPKKLRDEMDMEPGMDYNFSILKAYGHKYICIDCGENDEIEKAISLLKRNGMEVKKIIS